MTTMTNVLQIRTALAFNLWFWSVLRLPYVYLISYYAVAWRKEVDTYIWMGVECAWTIFIMPLFYAWFGRKIIYVTIGQLLAVLPITASVYWLVQMLDDYLGSEDDFVSCIEQGPLDIFCAGDKYWAMGMYSFAQVVNLAFMLSLPIYINAYEQVLVQEIEKREKLLKKYVPTKKDKLKVNQQGSNEAPSKNMFNITIDTFV